MNFFLTLALFLSFAMTISISQAEVNYNVPVTISYPEGNNFAKTKADFLLGILKKSGFEITSLISIKKGNLEDDGGFPHCKDESSIRLRMQTNYSQNHASSELREKLDEIVTDNKYLLPIDHSVVQPRYRFNKYSPIELIIQYKPICLGVL